MKIKNYYLNKTKSLIIILFFLSLVSCLTKNVYASEITKPEDLIWEFNRCVNEKNTEEYIDLFIPEMQELMKEHIQRNGTDNFFQEISRTIINIEKTDYSGSPIEKEKFDEICAYRVKEEVIYDESIYSGPETITSGEYSFDYIFARQDGKFGLYRVSVSDTTENDITDLESSDRNNQNTRSLSCPSTTTIYFTKQANISYWGYQSYTMSFQNMYLKNVLPNEWIISYYSLTAYAKASAIASKTYAWYYTIHPKWMFAPYYACMFDDDSDQHYLCSAYSNLNSSTYQGYVDSALSFASNRVMVINGTNNILETHYYQNTGSYHSGAMNATECLAKAQAGDPYYTILHYYYDNSPYTGTSNAMGIAIY